jgi:cell division septation protein DedD
MVKPNPNSKTDSTGQEIVIAVESEFTETPPKVSASKISEKLKKPFIQLGIFSIKENATNTGATMRRMGIMAKIKEQKIKNKVFWRVLVGPVSSQDERKSLLKKITSAGYKDAYAVTN